MRFWLGLAILFYGVVGLAVTLVMLGVDVATGGDVTTRDALAVLLIIGGLPLPLIITVAIVRVINPGLLGRAARGISGWFAIVVALAATMLLVTIAWLLARWADDFRGTASAELAVGMLLIGGALITLALAGGYLALQLGRRE